MTGHFHIWADWALLPQGWHRNVRIEWDKAGQISNVQAGADLQEGLVSKLPEDADSVGYAPRFRASVLVPGMINVHSHAFQRELVGRVQRFTKPDDDFWTWRTTMYELASRTSAAQLETVATRLYSDMLAAGYTTVCEFHYTHGVADAGDLDAAVASSTAILSASESAGIRLVHLPVLYQHGGFGKRPPAEPQSSFVLKTRTYLSLIDFLRERWAGRPRVTIGYAPHSLRAVGEEALTAVLNHRAGTASDAPVHIHIAEQMREVNECLLATGKRPVEWLLHHAALDRKWCLIHATHMTPEENTTVAESGAVVGLCPTTEADLGDGFFDLREYLASGGSIGIGSDSNTSVRPEEELRQLDYQNRLRSRRRNPFKLSSALSSGTYLYLLALEGGRKASGCPVGRIEAGNQADLVSLGTSHPLTSDRTGQEVLDAWLYSLGSEVIDNVFVGGKPITRTRLPLGDRCS